jgi:hypothetical protein
MLNVVMLSVTLLSVTYKPFKLRVIVLNVVMLSVIVSWQIGVHYKDPNVRLDGVSPPAPESHPP